VTDFSTDLAKTSKPSQRPMKSKLPQKQGPWHSQQLVQQIVRGVYTNGSSAHLSPLGEGGCPVKAVALDYK